MGSRYTNTMKMRKLGANRGFTVIELMIALSILSVILVTAASLMIRIGSLYSKGVNAANLQNANRNIISDITTTLEFSGSSPSGCATDIGITCYTDKINAAGTDVYAYCIGTTRFSYVLNRKSGTTEAPGFSPVPHVLWRDTMQTSGVCTPLDIVTKPTIGLETDPSTVPNSGYDMVPANMRLTRFRIEQLPPNTSGIYKVDVWMAYGDSDLVQADGDGHVTCSGGPGNQYCSGANISTTVVRRVGNVNN